MEAPQNFSIQYDIITGFGMFWTAPFSLNITYDLDIYYYTICTNNTLNCWNISNPECSNSYPRICNSSKTMPVDMFMSEAPVQFNIFAVNGAGEGKEANFTFWKQKYTAYPGKP